MKAAQLLAQGIQGAREASVSIAQVASERARQEALQELESAKYWYEFGCRHPERRDEAMRNALESLAAVERHIKNA